MEAHPKDALLRKAAEQCGTPSFVYFLDDIEQRADHLRSCFKNNFSLSYAVKSNPNPALLRWLASKVDYLDVSSLGEFILGENAGWAPARISFTGPAKRDIELETSIKSGVGELILESPREAVAANRLAGELGKQQAVLVRLGPSVVPKGFGDHMAGRPSPFGIDMEDIDAVMPELLALPNLKLQGFHIYSGTQGLKAEAIRQNYGIFMECFQKVCETHDVTPKKLIFGSGLGVPYHAADVALDLPAVAEGVNADLADFKTNPRFKDTILVLELGRYLVAEAGFFVTRVVSTKHSRGTPIAICDGGMNNHLPASGNFGMVVPRNYRMHKVDGGADVQKMNLIGPLCTSIDKLARGVELPKLEEGDLVAVHNSGAYGPTASPVHFISHPMPKEVLVSGSEVTDVTRKLGDIEIPSGR